MGVSLGGSGEDWERGVGRRGGCGGRDDVVGLVWAVTGECEAVQVWRWV